MEMTENKIQEENFRFLQDLEFVQCLANPAYLEFLASNGYFKDQSFINYLAHLQYFKRPEYLKYLTCLLFLDLLQNEFFRSQLYNTNFINYLIEQINKDWVNAEKENI